MPYLNGEMDISNISEHLVHISKNNEHGKSDCCFFATAWKLVKRAHKAFVHAGFEGIFTSTISEHH